jgi:cytochrome c oxidase cbb3-type subunit III
VTGVVVSLMGFLMRANTSVAAAALLLLASFAVRPAAQAGPPPAQPGAQAPPAPNAPPGGAQAPVPVQGGRGRGNPATFPAQQRPPGDPTLIARGQTLFGVNCRICHGADLRGGDMGGVNLLRSQLVLNDQKGELILPVVHNGRQNPGMPPMPPFPGLPDDDVRAIAEYIHSVAATMRGQGNPPPGSEPAALNIVVGDPAAGKAFFTARCSSCHSETGDLQGIATRISEPMQLQTTWVAGGGGGRGGRGGRGGGAKPVTATVTMPSGQKIEGLLERIDDFEVVIRQADGTSRTIRRDGAVPRVDINDPLEAHRQLLTVYTDKDIHDVTAYLVTLK